MTNHLLASLPLRESSNQIPPFAVAVSYRTLLAGLALLACLSSAAVCGASQYLVRVKTSDRADAGTDSNIFITFYGTKGTSNKVRTNGLIKGDAYERDTSDSFDPGIADIGPILKINVESDGLNAAADWHLETVTVTYFTKEGLKEFPSSIFNPAKLQEMMNSGKMVQSTFPYNDWITEYTRMGERPGADIVRQEAPVAPTADAKTSPARIYVVFDADALDSNNEVSRPWTSEITAVSSLTLETGNSDSVKVGVHGEWGYKSSGDSAPGYHVNIGLSLEYEKIRSTLESRTFGTEKKITREETFAAKPGTMEFRVLVGSGTVTTENYRSTLSGKEFTATYGQADADLNPRQITFTKGTVADDKWNRSVAHAFVLSRGEANYNSMVKRLKEMGCLETPLTAAEALAKTE